MPDCKEPQDPSCIDRCSDPKCNRLKFRAWREGTGLGVTYQQGRENWNGPTKFEQERQQLEGAAARGITLERAK